MGSQSWLALLANVAVLTDKHMLHFTVISYNLIEGVCQSSFFFGARGFAVRMMLQCS